MFSVEAYLLLPDDQRDRGNFPRQGQARHGWLPSLDEQSLVEIVEWPSGDGGHCRCTLEDVLKIVVMILVESTKLLRSLGTLQLSSNETVLRTVVCFYPQTAVVPQLPFGAESVRCLDQRDQ